MSELNEQRWSVMSERGCEVTRVAYADAAELVRRLRGEGMRGLCVISAEAASHLQSAKASADDSSTNTQTAPSTNGQPPSQRRTAKK